MRGVIIMNSFEKIITLIIILTLTVTFFTTDVFSQEYLDLSSFISINGGNWLLSSGNTSVMQLNKTSIDYYYLFDKELENEIITGTIKVNSSTYDNDTIGLVFGYKDINDSYIFSWDNGGIHDKGQLFYHKDRDFDHTAVPGELLFDGRAAGTGWVKGREYEFKATYLRDHFKLSINGKEIINIAGEFPKGKFGFFCFSQGKVNFSNILISSADHLIEPPEPTIEEMDKPIRIRANTKEKKVKEQLSPSYLAYQILNSSEYELSKAKIDIYLDKRLKVIRDSIKISKDKLKYNWLADKNILRISNFSLKPKEVFNLNFYVIPKNSLNPKASYMTEIGAYSQTNNTLVSNKVTTSIEYKKQFNKQSAVIIGQVNIRDHNKRINHKKEKALKIITSDGRVIKIDKKGRYHIEIDNFKSITDSEMLGLEIMLPKGYNKNTVSGSMNKLVKIEPGQLIEVDFNLEIGGHVNGK